MTNVMLLQDNKYVKLDSVSLANLPTDERIWVQLTNPNEIEVHRVMDELHIPEDFVRSALDDEEGPRFDDDDDTGYNLIVFDIPVTQHQDEESDAPYITMPLAIIQKDLLTVTVCLNDSPKFNEIKHGTLRSNVLLDSNKILYQFLLAFHSLYETYLRAIDKASSRLESRLLYSNKPDANLLDLMRLKNTLIYFASSLRQNIIVGDKLLAMAQKSLSEDDVETLENIKVEIEQAFATCTLQRELMTETMSTYANIVSNRLAERMRFLTIVTIILAIPTLIAGIYGMNVPLPFDNLPNLWPFILVCLMIIVACILVLCWVLPDKSHFRNKKKKPTHRRHRD